jgi:cyclic di-GMP phosphodiesterase
MPLEPPSLIVSAEPEPENVMALDETESILIALAQAVEQRDHQIAGHCERLAFMAVSLGLTMGLEKASLQALYRGGYLHDIGKVGIPDSILFKPERLTAEEWVIMRSHPTRGEEVCRHLKTLAPVLPIIRHHHERWDGTGYPDGLQRDQTPLLARIIQVADIYDALVSARPYKKAMAHQEAIRTMEDEAGRGWRDPEVSELFFRMHRDLGSKISDCTMADRSLENLRAALAGLHPYLA